MKMIINIMGLVSRIHHKQWRIYIIKCWTHAPGQNFFTSCSLQFSRQFGRISGWRLFRICAHSGNPGSATVEERLAVQQRVHCKRNISQTDPTVKALLPFLTRNPSKTSKMRFLVISTSRHLNFPPIKRRMTYFGK